MMVYLTRIMLKWLQKPKVAQNAHLGPLWAPHDDIFGHFLPQYRIPQTQCVSSSPDFQVDGKKSTEIAIKTKKSNENLVFSLCHARYRAQEDHNTPIH